MLNSLSSPIQNALKTDLQKSGHEMDLQRFTETEPFLQGNDVLKWALI